MEKYITSIKDLVALEMANAIDGSDESISNFQRGMIHLLGINTPVDLMRASQFFGNSSLKSDPDANRLLGFIEECEGNFSSSFKHYALAAESLGEKQESSYLQKVNKGREFLQKSFKKYNLPLTLNDQITKILNDSNKGIAKKKLNSKIVAAFLCEDESSCIEVAQELFDGGDLYSAKSLLQKGNVNSNCSLYKEIEKVLLQSIENIDTIKGTVLELESESILPDYNNSLSISKIKKECENSSISCCREWREATKIIIDKMVKSQKRIIAKEEEKKNKKNKKLIFLVAIPIILFIVLWIMAGSYEIALGVLFFYYCIYVIFATKSIF